MKYIDAHVHVWTDDTSHYPLAKGYDKKDMKPATFTPQELFTHSKGTRVDRINFIQMSYYGFDNSYMLDMMAMYKEAFVGTAVIDPQADGVEKLMSELMKKGVKAFRLHPRLTTAKVEKWLE